MANVVTEVDGPATLAPDGQVVAEILSDGTVRIVGQGEPGSPDPAEWEWTTGHVSGRGWILWWERRRWAPGR